LPPGYHYSGYVRTTNVGDAILAIPENTLTDRIDLRVVTTKLGNHKLAGRVVGQNGNGIADAVVAMFGGAQGPAVMQTDEKGHFQFNDCEWLARLVAVAKTPNGQRITGSLRTIGGNTNVEIRLPPPKPPRQNQGAPGNQAAPPMLPGG
jgi:hypothetical protein